ncbi:MAG: M28 family peptidase [Chitinophagaceae bacterium]|nr:M28 family peptidase [Chitinophagaceae bacterium]
MTAALVLTGSVSFAQKKDSAVVSAIVKEATENSQLEILGHELMDGIGPRLVGTPKMQQAHDWAVAKYKSWGIEARNEKWGEWRAWERGITHIDMVQPWTKTLSGTQLAWSPGTNGKTVTGETVIIPDLADSAAFQAWLPTVKGKFVLISMQQPTGRPEYNWKEFGTEESQEKMKKLKAEATAAWAKRISKTGLNARNLALALEKAGAVGIIQSYWSAGFGANKIFGANTKKIPTLDLSLEDYGLVYRLTESGQKPKLNVRADSKDLGIAPTFNTLAEIKGTEKPDEYVMLSAHFDSWDGGTGATDNGTGTLVMMEAMRILKKDLS